MLELVEVLWPVFVAIAGFIVYKLIPYMKTKIFCHKHYNIEMTFYLMEYEMLGTICANMITIIMIIVMGKSTWEKLERNEYVIAWCIMTIVYLVGIYLCIKRKKQIGAPKYIGNMALGLIIHMESSFSLLLSIEGIQDKDIDSFFFWLLIGMLLIQILVNYKVEKIKSIKYVVYTEVGVYKSEIEPIKKGKFYFVNILEPEKNCETRIMFSEDKLLRIEYLIENITEKDADSGSRIEKGSNDKLSEDKMQLSTERK